MYPINLAFLISIAVLIIIALITKNKWVKIAAGIISILGLVFYFTVSSVRIGQAFHVQNATGDFEFSLMPSKGRSFEMMNSSLGRYKEKNDITEEVELFRTERINYLNIKMWGSYSSNKYWDLKYISRTKPINNNK